MAGYTSVPEIEGFASATSVNGGDSLTLYVNVKNPGTDTIYKIRVYRMGWYNGIGARKMIWHDDINDAAATEINFSSTAQTAPVMDNSTGLIDCLATTVNGVSRQAWQPSYTFTVPRNWLSGVYLVKLTALTSLKASYIIFTVREDSRNSDLLFQNSVNTWEAYNPWGGSSLYPNPLQGKKVSFNRPYAGQVLNSSYNYGTGAGEFFHSIGGEPEPGWEYNALRWMEKQGYDLTYGTDVDTHGGALSGKIVKAFVSVGHDEYWSKQMRDAVTAARDQTSNPVNLVFLGANDCFWQVTFDTNSPTYRHFSCDKNVSTNLWRNVSDESSLVGIEYMYNSLNRNITIPAGSTNWIYSYAVPNTNTTTVLTNLLGYEVDGIWTPTNPTCAFNPYPTTRANIFLVASSQFSVQWNDCPAKGVTNSGTGLSYVSIYTNSTSSAKVFATGSMQWNWGLDEFGYYTKAGQPVGTNAVARQITDNVIPTFTGKPLRQLP